MSDLSFERMDLWAQACAVGTAALAVTPDADVFAQGFENGRRTVEAELAAEREALLQLVLAAEALDSPAAGLLAEMMIVAVERLVSDIAGTAPVDAVLLQERAEALASEIAGHVMPTLLVHPDDAALIDADRLDVALAADANLPRGSLQVRAGAAVVEDGVQAALGRLRAQIAAMGIAL